MEHLTLSDRAFQPYLDRVAQGLKVLPLAERTDLLRELASHLEDGRAAGEAPDVLMARMGAPEEVADALVRERLTVVDRKRSPLALFGLALQAAFLPLLAVIAVLVAVDMAIVTRSEEPVKELWSHAGLLIFFVVPFGMAMVGAFGIPKLHRELSPEVFWRVLPRFAVAVMGLAVLMTLAGYGLCDGWWSGNPADRGRLAQERAEIAALTEQRRALGREQASTPNRSTRLKLQQVEDRLELEQTLLSTSLTMPVFPLGVAAMGLVLGYACRRATFVVIVVAAGVGVIAQVAAASAIIMGALAVKGFGLFAWPGVLAQWFLVMTALVVALLLDRGERHVQ